MILKIFSRFLLASLTAQLFMPSVIAQDINSGLVSHYKFNSNTNDAGMHGYHLTNSGGVPAIDRFGKPNSAYYFDGSSYMIVDSINDTSFSNSVITFSSWVNVDGMAPGDWRILAVGKKNTYYQYQVQGITKNSTKPFWIGTTGSGYNYLHYSNASLSPGQWYQLTSVTDVNKDSSYVYINGELETQIYQPGITSLYFTNIFENIMIGASVGAGDYFEGSIDDVRIYKRALTAVEVAALYEKDTTTNPGIGISPLDNSGNPDFMIYPNPASDMLNIDGNFNVQKIDVLLSDGRLWKSFNEVRMPARLSLSDVPEGIYFVRMQLGDDRILNKKILVIR